MIRETACKKEYPSKTILEDVLERDGAATEDSYSPFPGMRSEFVRQFRTMPVNVIIYDLYNYVFNTNSSGYTDFDVCKAKDWIDIGTGNPISRGPLKCTTLEELMEEAKDPELVIKKYVTYMCVGFKQNKASALQQDKVNFTNVLFDREDMVEVDEKELMLDDTDLDDTERLEKLIERLPYLIKAIWSYSKFYQANLFSFIYAFMDMTDGTDRVAVSKVTPFRNYKLYRLYRNGEFHSQFSHEDDNKYDIYRRAISIFTNPSKFRNEWNFITPFINTIRLLGIDFRKEDPMIFTNEFVSRIVCTYLPDSTEYVNQYGELDAEVLVALKPENIFTVNKYGIYDILNSYNVKSKSNSFNYEIVAQHVLDIIDILTISYDTDPEQYKEITADNEDEVLYIANKIAARLNIQNPNFEFAENVLFCNKEIFVVPGLVLGNFRGSMDYTTILLKCGIAVMATHDYSEVFYLDLSTLLDLAQNNFYGGAEGAGDLPWGRFGV